MTTVAQGVPIHGIAAGGAGVGRLDDGRTVFVHRTAPGDRAAVTLTDGRRRWARGRLDALHEAGPGRRAPPCPFYTRCGGCTLQHLEYPEQVRWKRRIVEDALRRIGGLAVDVGPVTEAPEELGYRSRVTMTLRRLRGGRVVAGFHELDRPSRVFDLDGRCLLASPRLMDTWLGLRDAWGPGARSLPPGGELRLTLRSAEQGVVLSIKGGGEGGDAGALLERVDGLVAIWQVRNGLAPRLLAGRPDTTEAWLDERFPVRATGFLQVNRRAGEVLHRRVLGLARHVRGRVVDAYCGAGTFGRALARDGRQAVGIERDPEAAAAACAGAPEGFRLVEGRVESELPNVLPAELVIVNPPRTGLERRTVDALTDAPPHALIYVSCDPATLARDLARLDPELRVECVEAHDLFPQTAHVECLALCRRAHGERDTGTTPAPPPESD